MMGNKVIEQIVNPFIRIAGMKALGWGVLGLAVSTWICWISGYHYHGLLHFGPAPNPAWWCYLAEHLIVWLIPALLFFLGGVFLSHSHIRIVDVLGTVLFAQLPLLVMNLISLLPPMRMLSQMDMNMSPEKLLTSPLELAEYKTAIMEAMFKGTKRNVQSENNSKNAPVG